MLILQSLYNLSDDQAEYQVGDRLSFTRFLKLGIEDRIPDGTTLWLFREKLAKAGLIQTLFERFGQHLEAKGYIARGGQMVDATIVPVPKAAQHARGERSGQGWPNARGLGAETGEKPAEGQGRALDQEARQKLLWL
jgi:IS5 family transposase